MSPLSGEAADADGSGLGMIDELNVALAERYEIQSELGRGGMATVYLADDLDSGQVDGSLFFVIWPSRSTQVSCCSSPGA